jgi:hypothetical protein
MVRFLFAGLRWSTSGHLSNAARAVRSRVTGVLRHAFRFGSDRHAAGSTSAGAKSR